MIAPSERKKESLEVSKLGDTESAIATYFLFSCSAKYLAQDLTPAKTSAASIHT